MAEGFYDIEKALEEILSKSSDSSNSQEDGKKKSWDGLRRFYMSGSGAEITFIPVFNTKDPGFFQEFGSVPTFRGVSSKSNGHSFDFLVLPKEVYGDLNEEEVALHKEVSTLISDLYNLYKTDKKVDAWKEVRYRNFTLFWGVLISARYPNNAPIVNRFENCRGKACLFIFDRGKKGDIIRSMKSEFNSKVLENSEGGDDEGTSKKFLYNVFDNSLTGRKSSLKISCIGSDPKFTFRDDRNAVPKDLENISEETAKYFEDVLPTFLGFNYDRENKRLFNVTIFRELRDHLLSKIEAHKKKSGVFIPEAAPEDNGKVYENKNSLDILNQSDDEELPF